MNKRNRILIDHKKMGKKFIPPMLLMLDEIKYVKWLDRILPELIWIGIFQEQYGIKRSVEICCSIARASKKIEGGESTNPALISNYESLTSAQSLALKTILDNDNVLDELSSALSPLIILYPECPLSKFLENNLSSYAAIEILKEFKRILDNFFYRRCHATNVMEATALCMGMLSGHIKFVKGAVSPPDLNVLLMELPGTSLYEQTASSVRSMTALLVKDSSEVWSSYFWNRGLLIDGCQK